LQDRAVSIHVQVRSLCWVITGCALQEISHFANINPLNSKSPPQPPTYVHWYRTVFYGYSTDQHTKIQYGPDCLGPDQLYNIIRFSIILWFYNDRSHFIWFRIGRFLLNFLNFPMYTYVCSNYIMQCRVVMVRHACDNIITWIFILKTFSFQWHERGSRIVIMKLKIQVSLVLMIMYNKFIRHS
jgi:hypothetical protein